jgi:hypothetical protein
MVIPTHPSPCLFTATLLTQSMRCRYIMPYLLTLVFVVIPQRIITSHL